MRYNAHSYSCYCDRCSEARNKSAHAYVQKTNQGARYGESYDDHINRVRKECAEIEAKARVPQ